METEMRGVTVGATDTKGPRGREAGQAAAKRRSPTSTSTVVSARTNTRRRDTLTPKVVVATKLRGKIPPKRRN
jgi:hypothetical protein